MGAFECQAAGVLFPYARGSTKPELQTYLAIPISYIHFDSLKLSRLQEPIMGNEVSCLLKLFEPLL